VEPTLLGNWKMHLGPEGARAYLREFLPLAARIPGARLGVFPPLVSLAAAAEALRGSPVGLGAQSCHAEAKGAFTGEVAAEMLREAGCRWVLVGHSERRQLFGETDAVVRAKLRAALRAGLEPVLCVGETEPERDAGRTEEVLERQITAALEGMDRVPPGLLVAYEPVWAIGTGRNATPQQAGEAHAFLRGLLRARLGSPPPVLYGGSVKEGNVAELAAVEGVDGALVGGASLDPAGFARLCGNAARAR
jgi:triosephosphate isomerase